jgi:hypothetical protein
MWAISTTDVAIRRCAPHWRGIHDPCLLAIISSGTRMPTCSLESRSLSSGPNRQLDHFRTYDVVGVTPTRASLLHAVVAGQNVTRVKTRAIRRGSMSFRPEGGHVRTSRRARQRAVQRATGVVARRLPAGRRRRRPSCANAAAVPPRRRYQHKRADRRGAVGDPEDLRAVESFERLLLYYRGRRYAEAGRARLKRDAIVRSSVSRFGGRAMNNVSSHQSD